MSGSPQRFVQLLTMAIYRIRTEEFKTVKKTLRIVQDELGFALGRDGGSAIEYWRKGHLPAGVDMVEQLARELVRRGGLNQQELKTLLGSANSPELQRLIERLFPFPTLGQPIDPPRSRLQPSFHRDR